MLVPGTSYAEDFTAGVTFTGAEAVTIRESVDVFKKRLERWFPEDHEEMLGDNFSISLIKYKALE